jgi:hypothetical protein
MFRAARRFWLVSARWRCSGVRARFRRRRLPAAMGSSRRASSATTGTSLAVAAHRPAPSTRASWTAAPGGVQPPRRRQHVEGDLPVDTREEPPGREAGDVRGRPGVIRRPDDEHRLSPLCVPDRGLARPRALDRTRRRRLEAGQLRLLVQAPGCDGPESAEAQALARWKRRDGGREGAWRRGGNRPSGVHGRGPFQVELRGSNGECWGASFAAADSKVDGGTLRARTEP